MKGTTELQKIDLDALRAGVRGALYAPGDERYEAARAAWNLLVDHGPDAVVVAVDEQDVISTLRLASEVGAPITVQSTGHGQYRPANGGVLINTSAMNEVQIDPVARTARVGAGAIWTDVISAAAPHGLAPLSGSSPTVGVVGYLVGGGFSLLVRKYGLAIDHVKSLRVVLPGGKPVTASPTENGDLFWALCGGGGSFGVITEVEISLFPHATVYGGALMFPADRASELYRAFAQWTAELTEQVSAAIVMITYPPLPFIPEFLQGRSMLNLCACMPLEDVSQAEAWMKPMRDLGPEFDMMGPLPYTESEKVYNDPHDPLPFGDGGVLLKELDDRAIDALLASIGAPAQSPNLLIQLRHIGGAVTRGDQSRSVVGDRRSANYMLHLLGIPNPAVSPEAIVAHREGVFEAMQPWTLSRGPLNFVGTFGADPAAVRNVYGDNFDRLKEIKLKYDPQNLFRNAGIGVCIGD